MSDSFAPVSPQSEVVRETAVAVFARDAEGRALCQLRDDREDVAAAGQWCLFGGKVEAGESFRAAVAREFEEETGLRYAQNDFRPLASIASVANPDWNICIYELLKTVDPAEINLGEGAGFAMLTAAQIREFDFITSYYRFFDKFFD